MKVNPNDPAMPIKDIGFNVESEEIAMHEQHANVNLNFPGMSIRTELAARAMQGLLSNPQENRPVDRVAQTAVLMADVLIIELNKPTEQ